jgi:hypothetical protein
MIAGYIGVLSSPGFLYFDEDLTPGGSRAGGSLSYFCELLPDDELRSWLSREPALTRGAARPNRADERSTPRRFVDAFSTTGSISG